MLVLFIPSRHNLVSMSHDGMSFFITSTLLFSQRKQLYSGRWDGSGKNHPDHQLPQLHVQRSPALRALSSGGASVDPHVLAEGDPALGSSDECCGVPGRHQQQKHGIMLKKWADPRLLAHKKCNSKLKIFLCSLDPDTWMDASADQATEVKHSAYYLWNSAEG